ncbi:uncharacterized protein [Panulirus ornatus]|uniref:uncharacterized protein n=1 Tax=Panulirus ornatus TaxID=150431 RepID=UPI003A8AD75B
MKILVLFCLAATCAAFPFVGLVGPSGSIGPSGIVGPSGPVQFNQPAWAFLGNAAHEHLAAINRVKLASTATAPLPVTYQAAPVVPTQYGVDASGCVSGPSGKVCPTGNIQYV